jgi:PAS domain-containing protein
VESILTTLMQRLQDRVANLTLEQRTRLLGRLQLLLVRSFLNGTVIFLLATLSITVCAIAMRTAVHAFALQHRMIDTEVQRLLDNKTEADTETKPLLMAIAPVLRDGTCFGSPAACETASKLLSTFSTVLAVGIPTTDQKDIARLAESLNNAQSSEWKKVLVKDLQAYHEDPTQIQLSCKSLDGDTNPFVLASEGRADSNRISELGMFVPRTECTENGQVLLTKPATLDVRLSRVFDDALVQVLHSSLDLQPKEPQLSPIVRVRLSTSEGITRIWQSDFRNVRTAPMEFLADTAGRPSVARQLWLPSETARAHEEAGPYIDPEGFGVLYTICDKLEYPTETSQIRLCTDLRVPHDLIVKAAKGSALLKTYLVSFDTSRSSQLEAKNLDSGGAASWPRNFSAERFQRLLTDEELAHMTTNPVRLYLDADPAFVVPLERTQARFYFLLIELRGSRPPGIVYLMLIIATLTFLATFGLGVAGARQTRNALKMANQVVRGLPVAILQIDRNDQIIEGNSRAEEIFGCDLPRQGVFEVQFSKKPVLSSLLEEAVVMEADGLGNIASKELLYRDILECRARGEPVRYFARLMRHKNLSRGWLKISETPIADAADERVATKGRKDKSQSENLANGAYAVVEQARPSDLKESLAARRDP